MPNRCPETVSNLQNHPFFGICSLFSGSRLKASRWLALGMGLLLLWAMGPAAAQVYHWKSQTYVGGVEVRTGTELSGPALSTSDAYGRLGEQTGELSLQLATGSREQNAIRAADALAALRMAVGLTPQAGGEPASPYQYWAADVNGDGRVTAADALEILRQAVRSPDAVEKRWVFVPEALATNPTTPITRQQVPLPGKVQAGQAVVAVLVGDVLGTWVPPTEAIAVGTTPPPPNDDPGRDPDDTSPPIPLQPETVEGFWIGECRLDNELYSYEQSIFELQEEGKLVQHKARYSDGSCRENLFRVESVGEYAIGREFIASSTGYTAYEVDLRIDEVWLTLHHGGQAEALSREGFCGRSDWRVDSREDITDCPEVGAAEIFNIVSIRNEASGRVLYIGDASGDGQTSATRPSQLDVTRPHFFHRQIRLDGAGGEELRNQFGIPGRSVPLPAEVPFRMGFEFQGWNTAADGSGTAYAAGAEITLREEDVTLYAQWRINVHVADSAEGLWQGTTNTSRTITGLVLDDGTYWFIYSAVSNSNIIAGVVQGNGSFRNGSFRSTNGRDFNLEGLGINPFTLAGTYTAKNDLSGELSYSSGGFTMTFTSRYNTDYDLTPGLAAIAGTYEGFAATSAGSESAAVSVNAVGAISGRGESGCRFTGNATPRTQGNSYNIVVTFGGGICANGTSTVTGVAYFDSATNQIISAALNGARTDGFVYAGIKQSIQSTLTFDSANGSAVSAITGEAGSAVTAPVNPTREGYTFAGWSPAIPTTIPAENQTFTAQWEINSYTLTFDSDGGSEVADIEQDFGTAVTAPANPTRSGYTFTGWSPEIPDAIPAVNQTFTAQWEVNQHTLIFDSAGGSTVAAITHNFGTDVTAPASPTRTGYTFAGWSPAIPTTIPAENQTLAAQWEINQYTLTFIVGGATVATIRQDFGTVVTAPTNPTRDGHFFRHWNTAADGLGSVYRAGEEWTIPAENQTLYAQWVADPFGRGLLEDRYIILGEDEEIVLDIETGLEWMRCALGQTWDRSTKRCKGNACGHAFANRISIATQLNNDGYGGYSDWRVPSGVELGTLVYCSSGQPAYFKNNSDMCLGSYSRPTIVHSAFPDTPSSEFWSDSFWDQNFYSGSTGYGLAFRAGYGQLRLVRGANMRLIQSTLTFDSAGGSSVSAITGRAGAAVTAPANPTRIGYTFTGWSPAIPTIMPRHNWTITAQWESIRVTNTGEIIPERYEFIGLDGGIVRDVETGLEWMRCSLGQTWDGSIQRCTGGASGHDFNGAQSAATELNRSGGYGGFTDWRAPNIDELQTIVFCSSGQPAYFKKNHSACSGSYSHPTILEAAFPNTPDGWFWSGTRADPSYANNSWVLYFFSGVANSAPPRSHNGLVRLVRGEDTQLIKYTLTFDSAVGASVFAITGEAGAAVTAPVNPTREGYTFAGWSPAIPTTIPAENQTFTAQWEINSYTLTFDSDGGSEVADIEQDFGTAVTAPANPTRSEYTFTGWSPEIPDAIPAVNQTFTAQWESIDGSGTSELISGRYEILGANRGIVRDVETGLEWMRCSLGQTWNSRIQRCTGCASTHRIAGAAAVSQFNNSGGFGGYTDWRVPSIEELRTLVYCSSGQPAYFKNNSDMCLGSYSRPTIVHSAFPDTPSSFFWSGSPNAHLSGNDRVRLVRGGQ